MPKNLKTLIRDRMARTGETYQTAHRQITGGAKAVAKKPKMTDKPSPSAHGRELWQITTAEAVALVDQQLGLAADWEASALMEYRLTAEFQADWKAEVGHWLHAAARFGFLDKMLRPVHGERKRSGRSVERDPNDRRHLKVHQHLASATFCHYFTGLGWSFNGWETEPPGEVDIDLALNAPDGTLVELQIKAPDQPGRVQDGRYVDGNDDRRVIEALNKAANQLPKQTRSVAMIAVYAQRAFSLPSEPRCVIRHAIGITSQLLARLGFPEDGIFLPREAFGTFMRGEWNHVAGIILLDMVRASALVEDKNGATFVDSLTYPCTVLLNPNADRPANADWFPKARVLTLERDRFRWVHGTPPNHPTVTTGTRVVEQLFSPQPPAASCGGCNKPCAGGSDKCSSCGWILLNDPFACLERDDLPASQRELIELELSATAQTGPQMSGESLEQYAHRRNATLEQLLREKFVVSSE